jgi:hypothetical protein
MMNAALDRSHHHIGHSHVCHGEGVAVVDIESIN